MAGPGGKFSNLRFPDAQQMILLVSEIAITLVASWITEAEAVDE